MNTLLEREIKRARIGEFGLDPSLVLYLPLWKRDGSTIMSEDMYGHLCTVTGAVWGIRGRTFAGGDDLISCGNSSLLNFTTGDFSIWAWINPAAITNDNYAIFTRGVKNADGYAFHIYSDGICFGTYQASANQLSAVFKVLAAGVWAFVGVARTGASAQMYVNGAALSETVGSHANPTTNTRNAEIGHITYDLWWWGGIIGEVGVWSRLLSATEMKHIYLATKWRYS